MDWLRKSPCPEGQIQRKSYTRKSGTPVKSACVRKTIKNSKTQNKRLNTILGPKKVCKEGEISRAAYIRTFTNSVRQKGYTRKTKSGKQITVYPKATSTVVPSTCIKDLGKPGKLPEGAPQIGPLRKGEMKKYGYGYKLPERERRIALKKAIHDKGALNIYRKLDAIDKLSERTNPRASGIFRKDKNWIRSVYSVNGTLKAF